MKELIFLLLLVPATLYSQTQFAGGDLSVKIRSDDSPDIDAIGRWRVSNPTIIFDSKQIFDNQPLFWDESLESGAGITSSHNVNEASTVITSSSSTAGEFTRQTFMRFNYQPGKSQEIALTGILNRSGGGIGVQRMIGYFDDDNGLFFEFANDTMKVVCRTNATGTPVDNSVNQYNWNIDPVDGSGPSGLTIDWTKIQKFLIDFEWLGSGRVRMGLANLNGMTVYVHEFRHSNALDKVYMSTPNLPIRAQMVTTASSPASTMEIICVSVISSGGDEELGVLRHKSTAGTQIDMDVEDSLYAIVGIRLKSTHIGSIVKIVKVAVSLQSSSDDIEWVIIFDPFISGNPSYTTMPNSSIEYFIGTNTVSGGVHIEANYVSSGSGTSASALVSQTIPNALRLGNFIDGTPQTIVLCARPINGSVTNIKVEGGITWREL